MSRIVALLCLGSRLYLSPRQATRSTLAQAVSGHSWEGNGLKSSFLGHKSPSVPEESCFRGPGIPYGTMLDVVDTFALRFVVSSLF
jgi:hypothetical protein